MKKSEEFEYWIIDPINTSSSGITTYSLESFRILREAGFCCKIISINEEEKIEAFRRRLARSVSMFGKGKLIIEAPETLASTKYITAGAIIHIRLHFSKVLGGFVERKNIDKSVQIIENDVLKNAHFISSPSLIGAELAVDFFEIKKYLVYPNPLTSKGYPTSKRLFDVGFVGRWQELKGIEFVKDIIKNRKGYRFIISTDEKGHEELSEFENVTLLNPKEKERVYLQSKYIIVPSLFETWSMVAVEAISAGSKVVAWSHLGICESISSKHVKRVDPFSLQKFKLELDDLLSIDYETVNQGEAMLDLKREFLKGTLSIINDVVLFNDVGVDCKKKQFISALIELDSEMNKKKELTSFERKFRKLRRTPVRFFVDVYKKKRGLLDVPERRANANVFLGKETKLTKKRGKRRAGLFCDIKSTKDYGVHDYGERNKGFRVVFVFDRERYESFFYKNILEAVYNHEDFMPFRRECLGRGYIDYSLFVDDADSGSFSDSLNAKKRKSIENANIIVLFDCIEKRLLELFRYATPHVKVVTVYTATVDVDVVNSIIGSDLVDAVLVSSQQNCKTRSRKLQKYKELEDLHLYIRKLVQEYIPRSPNLLVPVYGKNEYIPQIDKYEGGKINGLVLLKKDANVDNSNLQTFSNYLNVFSKNIESIYLTEETYMSYKTLCDDIENSECVRFFLEKSLMDGCMYDVK